MQIREMQAMCERRKWQPQPFTDLGWSGSKERRPELDRLLAECRRGKIHVVMVYRFDRFARSLRQLVNALAEFDALGIQFVSVHEHIDTTTPQGRLMFQIVGAFAEFERAIIQERVRSGMQNARAKGVHIGRPRSGLNVDLIRQRRAANTPWRAIAKELGVSPETCRRTLTEAS